MMANGQLINFWNFDLVRSKKRRHYAAAINAYYVTSTGYPVEN